MPFYYPNWINDFWRIMGLIFFGDRNHFCLPGKKAFDETAIRAFCEREGLAFYDTAREVRRLRDNASDAFLEVVTPTDVPRPAPEDSFLPDARHHRAESHGSGGAGFRLRHSARRSIHRHSISGRRQPHPFLADAVDLPLDKKADAYRRLFPFTD